MSDPQRNRRLGALLALFVIGLMAYSFLVIKHRGSLPQPENLPKWKRILRGL